MAAKYCLYNVESLNFLAHALCLFYGCRILRLPLPNLSTETLISTPIYAVSLDKKTWLIAEPNSGYLKVQPSMYYTNEQVHVCVPESQLVQYKVVLAEFRIGEACYGRSGRKFSVNLRYQQQWLKQLRRWNTRNTDLGTTSIGILNWSSFI